MHVAIVGHCYACVWHRIGSRTRVNWLLPRGMISMVLIYSIRTHGTATRRYLSEVRSCTQYIAVLLHSYYAEYSAGVKGYLRGSGLGPVGDRFSPLVCMEYVLQLWNWCRQCHWQVYLSAVICVRCQGVDRGGIGVWSCLFETCWVDVYGVEKCGIFPLYTPQIYIYSRVLSAYWLHTESTIDMFLE